MLKLNKSFSVSRNISINVLYFRNSVHIVNQYILVLYTYTLYISTMCQLLLLYLKHTNKYQYKVAIFHFKICDDFYDGKYFLIAKEEEKEQECI